jgi:4-hydroxybenzoate polyprenyltransferase
MNNLLYLIAFLLIFAWAIGYYDYGAGPFIHSLLVLAAVVILARLSGNHIDHLFDFRHKKN